MNFISVSKEIIKTLPISMYFHNSIINYIPGIPNYFVFFRIIEADISYTIIHPKRSNSYDIFNNYSNIIKQISPTSIEPLTYLFSSSVRAVKWLQKYRVVPIYRKEDIVYYRPFQ